MRRDCVKYGGVGVLVVWVACYVLFAAALYDDAGRWLMPWEVFTDGRLLMFMGIWPLLAFYCGYGLRKEFLKMRDATLAAFPDLAAVVKEVRREFTLKYLGLLFPLFCLLPFAYWQQAVQCRPLLLIMWLWEPCWLWQLCCLYCENTWKRAEEEYFLQVAKDNGRL